MGSFCSEVSSTAVGAEAADGSDRGVPYHDSYPGCATKSSWEPEGGLCWSMDICARNRARGVHAC